MSEFNGYEVLKGTAVSKSQAWTTGGTINGLIGEIKDLRKGLEADPHGKEAHEPGSKLDHGKCAAGVLHDFALALQAIASVGDFGMKKYTRGGWQSVPNGAERYFDAMWRHILKARHEELDPDSGLPHLDHALWNLAAVIELRERAKVRN